MIPGRPNGLGLVAVSGQLAETAQDFIVILLEPEVQQLLLAVEVQAFPGQVCSRREAKVLLDGSIASTGEQGQFDCGELLASRRTLSSFS